MYVVVYLIILAITTFVINKINNVESNNEFLRWGKREILIIGILFLIAIILQCLDFIIPQFFIVVYGFVALMALVYANKNREKVIQEYKKQIEQVYDSIGAIETKGEEIDYNELPFSIEKDGEKINKITVQHTDPKKHTDPNCTNVVYSLKNYFPYYDWQYTIDYPKQETVFFGQKLPPEMALWPGSDLRDSSFVPVGLGGAGEVALDLGTKQKGESSYKYEDGSYAGDVKMPSAPQYLVVGSPLSLDTVIPTTKGYTTMGEITTDDIVYDIKNQPCRVKEVHEIHHSDEVYAMKLWFNTECVIIKSDGIHKFPTVTADGERKEMTMRELFDSDKSMFICGSMNSKWEISSVARIPGRDVRCITVESSTHMFLVISDIEKTWWTWNDRSHYPFYAPATRNTGGGKAIWTEQELW